MIMKEVPEHIAEECARRFGGEVFFHYNQFRDRFECRVKMSEQEGDTYLLFMVETPERGFRFPADIDLTRIAMAYTPDSQSKIVAEKKIEQNLRNEKTKKIRARQDAFTKRKANNMAQMEEIIKNPNVKKAFLSKAKSIKMKEVDQGNGNVLIVPDSAPIF